METSWRIYGPQRVEVLRPQIAYLITSILTDSNARSMLFGSNDPLKLSRPAAAKTGTTENNQDLWTIGYTRTSSRVSGLETAITIRSPLCFQA